MSANTSSQIYKKKLKQRPKISFSCLFKLSVSLINEGKRKRRRTITLNILKGRMSFLPQKQLEECVCLQQARPLVSPVVCSSLWISAHYEVI